MTRLELEADSNRDTKYFTVSNSHGYILGAPTINIENCQNLVNKDILNSNKK